jgi:hypothetical protein
MMRNAKFGLTMVVAALVALGSARPTEAQNPGRTCAPFNTVTFDMCTGEFVAITGEACTDIFFHVDASGGAHVTIHETIRGTAVGVTSGNEYVFHTEILTEENVNSGNNAQDELTLVADANLISKGSLPNDRATITTHITIDANGDVTSMDVDLAEKCDG